MVHAFARQIQLDGVIAGRHTDVTATGSKVVCASAPVDVPAFVGTELELAVNKRRGDSPASLAYILRHLCVSVPSARRSIADEADGVDAGEVVCHRNDVHIHHIEACLRRVDVAASVLGEGS